MKTPRPAVWHHLPVAEAVQLLNVDLATGLNPGEVARRLVEFGPNRLPGRRLASGWLTLLKQFAQPLVWLLLVAGAVMSALHQWVDAFVIFGVVVVNALVGFLQEAKAERAVAALARLVVTESTVLREGTRQRIPSDQLVPGDVVFLEAGDRVPADVRLIRVNHLQVDESMLTGESVPVSKHCEPLAPDTLLADRKNLAFTGTLVTAGAAEGVVWATGDKTQTGYLAQLVADAVELKTPLTLKIAQFSRVLLWLIAALAAATFAIGTSRGEPAAEMFLAAVALAVGAIPEGLPAALTVVLAFGVARMARRRAIIRKLPAVETLGCTTVICSDKTGTLTENQMTVSAVFAGGRLYTVTGTGYEPRGEIRETDSPVNLGHHPALAECLRAGLLCNDARLSRTSTDGWRVQGDPTEAALLVAAEKAGLVSADALRDSPRLDMIPFASEQMFRATLHEVRKGRVIYKAGAGDRLLDRCADQLNDRGERTPLDRATVHAAMEAMAAQGLRVLAFARRELDGKPARLEHQHVAGGLTFLGLQGMQDPPRPEALSAIQRCRQAGIQVKMVTGDHASTARAVARRLGLTSPADASDGLVLTGRELEKVPDDLLVKVVDQAVVFARVSPEQKLRLVRALQAGGHIVTMTGDGVNDAPALKQADIGVAMGRAGTDVARGAADVVLTDDNFASIEAAVEEGRGIYDNLTKFILWTLPTNLGEALILFTAIVFGLLLPALPLHLLWVNLTTAILLGLTLVVEPQAPDLMKRPPRNSRQPLLDFALFMRTGLVSLLMLLAAFWLFFWELKVEKSGELAARTAVVNVIVLIECAYLFNCRSTTRPLTAIGWFSNPLVPVGVLAMLAAQLAFTYLPVMNRLFHTAPIDAESWVRISAAAVLAGMVVELEKKLRRRRD